MIKGNQKDVQPIPATMPGAKGAGIQWLIAKPEGAPNFYMRRVIVEEGGLIPVHQHPEQHEMYILSGQGRAEQEGESTDIGPGDFLFVPSGIKHSVTNTGPGQLTFICCINVVGE